MDGLRLSAKQKKPQIGDLVRLIKQPWHTGYDMLFGIVVEHHELHCKVFYTDGRMGRPMRETLEVL